MISSRLMKIIAVALSALCLLCSCDLSEPTERAEVSLKAFYDANDLASKDKKFRTETIKSILPNGTVYFEYSDSDIYFCGYDNGFNYAMMPDDRVYLEHYGEISRAYDPEHMVASMSERSDVPAESCLKSYSYDEDGTLVMIVDLGNMYYVIHANQYTLLAKQLDAYQSDGVRILSSEYTYNDMKPNKVRNVVDKAKKDLKAKDKDLRTITFHYNGTTDSIKAVKGERILIWSYTYEYEMFADPKMTVPFTDSGSYDQDIEIWIRGSLKQKEKDETDPYENGIVSEETSEETGSEDMTVSAGISFEE